MKMTNITFTYDSAPKPQLEKVTVRVSLSTRAACIGANGAGKSTMIKLLTGELEPGKGSGDVWRHPNCRVAYVAQHAFHHIEKHLEKTPNEYIRWRYEHGSDKEGLEKITAKMSAEEEAALKNPIQIDVKTEDGKMHTLKLVFKRFTDGRRVIGKDKEPSYEIQWQNDTVSWVPKSKLVQAGFDKLIKQADDRIAALATQLVRPLTQKFVENHLVDVGLEPEFGTHTRMGALSGGQKVKVLWAATMWIHYSRRLPSPLLRLPRPCRQTPRFLPQCNQFLPPLASLRWFWQHPCGIRPTLSSWTSLPTTSTATRSAPWRRPSASTKAAL
jgi:elongation factor 3